MNKQITKAANEFRKSQKRGYKGTLTNWLVIMYPSIATAEVEEAVAKKIAAYGAQAAEYAAR